jgi:hypothetical protein
MSHQGNLIFNGEPIPAMNLGTKRVYCRLDHPMNPRMRGEVLVLIECGGSHQLWTAISPVLDRGAMQNHPLTALSALLNARGCVLLSAEIEKKGGERFPLTPVTVAT